MALKEFPANRNSHAALFDITRGDFSFTAGELAKAGHLEIATPFANIRGRSRVGGIGTLSLISLFFAAMEKVQAAPSNVAHTDDELVPIDYTSEPHGSFEVVTKEATPRHFFVADPGVTWSFRLSSSSELTVSQSANSPARMEQLHTIQQNVLHTYSVGLQAMQGPTFNGQNGSTTNPNFREVLPSGARPINFQPDNSGSSQSLTTTSLEVTNSSSGASKTSGATTSVSDSDATSPTSLALDSIFVPPAPPPAALPSAPPAPVITTTAPAQNNASSIDIAGTAEANSTVTLFNNSSTVGTATADSSGHWSVPGVALSSGVDYSFTATATDGAGTSKPSIALAFHDNQTAGPTAVATVTALSADTGTAGDFITGVAAQTVSGTFTGTLGAGEKIQVSADGGTTWVDATPVGSNWTASGVTLSAGTGALSVRTIDTANNTTAGSGHSFTLDTVAPTAPGVALTSDTGSSGSDHITNNPALTLTNIESGAKVEYSLDGGTTWSISAPTIAQLVQGSNTVDVRQTDVAGNVSGLTAFTFTLDTVVPTIAITTPIAGDNIVNAAEAAAGFSIQGTTTGIADGQTATIVLVNSANAVVDTYTPIVSGNAWSISVTQAQAQALANGSYTVKADVSDVAGNAAGEASQALSVNKAALSIAITSPIAGDNIVNAAEAAAGFSIQGTTTGVADGQIATITIVNSANTVLFTFNPVVSGNAWSVTVPGTDHLPDGSYTIKADVSDGVGNQAPEAKQTLTVDETAPAAPGVALTSDTGSSSSDHITNNPALTLTNIESGAKVEYSLDGGTTWSISAPTIAQLVQGSNTVDVRQTDVAGNVSGLTAFTFTLDTVVPAAPGVALASDTGSSGSDHITNNPALTLTNIESGAKVEYSLDGGTTWSISAPTIAQLVQGSNTVDVRQTDVAGNVSGLTAFTFTLDTVVPTIAITTPIAGDNIVNAAEAAAGFSIQGTTTGIADGQTATIVLVNSANAVVDTYTPIVSGNAWSISVTQAQAQALANGSYTVKADVSDVAGNAAGEASQA